MLPRHSQESRLSIDCPRVREQWFCDSCDGVDYITNDTQVSERSVAWYTITQDMKCRNCLIRHIWEDGGHPDRYTIQLPEINAMKEVVPQWTYQEPLPFIQERLKEYWYYLVWTHAPGKLIEDVKANIEKLKNRDLGIFYMDISFEHGELNGREHYNMRIKSHRPIKKQRIAHYEKQGKINMQTIRKQTSENWLAVGNYCEKESEIEVLINNE